MQAVSDTNLITFEDWTLRVRPAETAGRLLVLIHGLTGDENSMWVFTRGLPPDYWIMAPRAPHPAEPAGYSWHPLHSGAEHRPGFENLRPAAAALLGLIDRYSASVGVEASRFDLVGFSQGAAVANLLSMLHPERVRRLCVLAGFVPSGMDALIAKRPLQNKPVFVAHGTEDKMVPIDRARSSIELLKQAGARVTYCEDDVGHKVSVSCLRALAAFLAEADA